MLAYSLGQFLLVAALTFLIFLMLLLETEAALVLAITMFYYEQVHAAVIRSTDKL